MGRYKRLIWDALREDPVVGRDARGILAGLDSGGVEPKTPDTDILNGAESSRELDPFSLEALFPETLAPVVQPPAATPREQPPITDPLSAESMFGSLLRETAPSNAVGGKAAVSLFDATPISEDLLNYGQLPKELPPLRTGAPDLTERLLAATRGREAKDAAQSFDDPSGWLSAIVGEADARRTKEPSMNLDKLLDVFKANADKNFVRRILDPQKSLVLDEGNIATHKMSYSTLDGGRAMMYPTIVERDGELVELSPKDAVEYARKTGEYIVLPEKAAEWATQNYKRLWDRIGPTEPDKTDIRLREREFQQRPTQAEDAFQTGLIEGLTGIKLKPDEDLRPSGKIAKAAAGGFGELVGWSPYFSPAGKAAGAIGSLLNLGSKAATRAIVGGLSGAAAAGARKTLTGAGDADSMAAAAAGGAVAAPVFGAMSDFIFQKLPGMWGRLTGKTKMAAYEGRTETGGANAGGESGGESGGAGVPLDLGRYTKQDYVTFLQEMGNATQKGGFDAAAFNGKIRGDDAALFYGLYNESGSFQQAIVQAAKGKGAGRFWISQGDAESAFRFINTLKAQTPKATTAPAQQRPVTTPPPATRTPPIPQEAPKPSGVAQTPRDVLDAEVVVETPPPPAGETTRQQKRPEVLEAEVVTDAADGDFAKRVEGAPDDTARNAIFQQEGAVLYPDLRPEDQVAAGRNAYLVSNGTMSQTEADKLGQMAILTGLWQKKGVDIPPEPAEHETPTSPEKVENASRRQIVPVADAQANVANAGETPQPQGVTKGGDIPTRYRPENTRTADLLAELEKRGSIVTLKDGRKEIVLHPGVEKETPVVESRAADAPQEIDTTPQASEVTVAPNIQTPEDTTFRKSTKEERDIRSAKERKDVEESVGYVPGNIEADLAIASEPSSSIATRATTMDAHDKEWGNRANAAKRVALALNPGDEYILPVTGQTFRVENVIVRHGDILLDVVDVAVDANSPTRGREIREWTDFVIVEGTDADGKPFHETTSITKRSGVVAERKDVAPKLDSTTPQASESEYVARVDGAINARVKDSLFTEKGAELFPMLRLGDQLDAGRFAYLVAKGKMTPEEFDGIVEDWRKGGHFRTEAETSVNAEKLGIDEPFLDKVTESVLMGTRTSIPNLQRDLRIGFTKAQAALEVLEKRGVVGPVQDDGRRMVLKRDAGGTPNTANDLVAPSGEEPKENQTPESKTKREPWQKTREEYSYVPSPRRRRLHSGESSTDENEYLDEKRWSEHKEIVRRALDDGKDVPARVLASYPDLVKEKESKPGRASREPWEMTRNEYELDTAASAGGVPIIDGRAAQRHENIVKMALIEGKPVPDYVLKDYPWLKKQIEREAVEPEVVQSSQIEPVIPPEARTDDRRRDDTDNAEPLEDELPEGIQGAREERPDGSDGRREDDAVGDGRAEAGQPGDVGQGGVDGGEVSVLPQEAVRPGRGNSGVQGVLGGVGGSSGGRKVSGKKEAVPGVGDEDAGGSGTNTADGGADGRDSSDGVEGESGRGNGRDRTVEPSVEQPVTDQKPNDIREGGKPSEIAGENPGNFVITESLGLGEGTDGEKISRNLAAIRTLRTLQKENRYPTREEQAVMARYVGWGGLKPVFDIKKKGATDMYGRAQTELRKILTKEEYDAAAKTVTDAHYTAKGIVDAMWRVVRHMGFSGGRVLEPTVGTGNFIGLEPEDLAAATEWHASEIDTITSRLAAALYPSANVLTSTGFEHANFAEGAFDLAIGNPPFGRMTLIGSNPNLKHLNGMKIHNYIIAKTGTHLRPGGVMAMVVTHRFLDTANPEAREFLAKSFRFLGAFRLPNDAFMANAGTKVVTDVVFFQKLRPGEKADKAASWLDVDGKLENGISVNRYYQENPAHIIGNSTMNGKMNARHGEEGEYTVESDGRDLGQAIDDLIAGDFADLAGILEPTNADRNLAAAMLSESDIPIGGMLLDDKGKIMRRDMNDSKGNAVVDEVTPESLWKDQAAEWEAVLEVLSEVKKASSKGKGFGEALDLLKSVSSVAYKADGEKLPRPTRAEAAVYMIRDALEQQGDAFQWTFDAEQQAIEQAYRRKQLGQDGYSRLKGLLDLRNRVLALNLAERTGANNIERLRSELNVAYDAFVKKNGFINDPRNFSLLGGDIGAESGLEIDYERPVTAAQSQKTGVPERGSLAKKADILKQRISWPEKIIDHADSAEDALKISLSERGKPDIAFMAKLTSLTPSELIAKLTGGEKPQLYLNPATNEYEHADAYLSGNVKKKLHEAQLAGLEQNIKALEAVQPAPKTKKQIRPNITGSWMPVEIFKGFLEALGVKNLGVQVLEGIGRIIADGDDDSLTDFGMQFNDKNAGVLRIFNAAAAGKTITITRKDPDGKTFVLEDETARVNAILTRMSEVFEDWAYSDEMRAEQIVDAFNRKMNTHVDRKYDGVSYLKPVGASPSIKLRSTQINAAWRMIQSLNVLLDHVVGAGKTFTIITGVMERRRLGLSKKPLIVVPNHLVTQWAQDFYKLYPSAKILAASQADFTKKNRRRLFARIATGDFDAIVIGHSSMKFIESPVDDVRDTIQEQIRLLEEALEAARGNKESKRTVAQIQERLKKYEQKLGTLTEQTNANKDAMGLDFKALGIDYLAVDEAHEFKNLEYMTSADRVSGMNDPHGSQKAFDLYIKVRGLQRRGGGIVFATGTPISNSIVEIYTIMKYLAHDDLVDRNQLFYDAWAGAYAKTVSRLEYNSTQKLAFKRVLAGLNNLSALSQIYKGFADTVLMTDLKRTYREEKEESNRRNSANERTDYPVPQIEGGGRRLDTGAATALQKEFTDYLIARYDAVKKAGRDKEYRKIDNPLVIMTDAKKASLDPRIIDPRLPRDENGKVMRSARNIKAIYDEWSHKRGAQLVFCDLSVPSKSGLKKAKAIIKKAIDALGNDDPEMTSRLKGNVGRLPFREQWDAILEYKDRVLESDETSDARRDAIEEAFTAFEEDDVDSAILVADTGFSVYDDLKQVLCDMGIPETEIQFIHDYESSDAKQGLFDRVKSGYVRVLIGSSAKMGAGMNVQTRLVALHHLDAPWRPSDMWQREGRIIRQGNTLYWEDPDGFRIRIYSYGTEETSDTVQWQILERKAAAIEQFRGGDNIDSVTEEGSDADQYADFMAASTGNPVFRLKLQAEKRWRELEAEISGVLLAKQNAQSFLQTYETRKANAEDRQKWGKAAAAELDDLAEIKEFDAVIDRAKAAYEKEYDQYVAKKEQADAALEQWEQSPEESRGDKPPMPSSPRRPGLLHPAVQAKSTYAVKVKDAIEALETAPAKSEERIPLGELTALVLKKGAARKNGTYDLEAVLYKTGDAARDIGRTLYSTEGINFDRSTSMMDALLPDSMRHALKDESSQARYQLGRLKEIKERSDEVAKIAASVEQRDEAKRVVDWYSILVSLAEREADVRRGGKFNRFIAGDHRRKVSQSAKIELHPFDATVDGERYSATGIQTSKNRLTYHQAVRESDGASVVLMEADHNPDKPAVYEVLEQPESLRIQDDEIDVPGEGNEYAHGGGGRMPLPKERADAEPMKLERIRALVGQLARWRFGRISERGALGVHKPRDQVIRTKGQYDFQIALHELGHNLARKMGLHKNLNKAAMLELETMGAATSPAGVGKSYRINEGIAQFVQAYALDDANAKKQAPAFFQIFEKRRSAVPELSELMEEIFNAIRDYFAATPQKRLDAAVFSARDKDPREKGIRRRVKAALYYGYEKFFDDLLPVRLVTDQIRETYGGPLPDELNLYAQFRTLSGYMKRADQDVDAMLGAIRGMGADDYKALTRYLIAQRSLDYFDNKMIPGTLSKAESQRVINETPASVAVIADEIREAYNRMVDRTLLSSGIVSQDQLDAMRRKWPHYVPFVRDMGDEGAIDALVSGDTGGKGRGKKITNISSPIKRAKGLADENERTRIEDPVEVMVHNAVVFHGLAARNEVGQMMVHAARMIDGLGWLAEELDDAGASKRDAAFWVWHDGVKKYYATDPDIYAVVTALTSQGNAFTNNAIARFVEGFATVFKLGTTRWNPAFPFVNFSRDAFTVSTQSKSFAPPFSHTVRGLAMILKNDPILAEAIEEGVFYSALTSLPRGSDMKSIAQEIHRAIRTGSAGAVVNALLSIANGVGKGNENVEIGPKIDEYRRLRAQGMAKKEAAMRAREVNTDFARAGSWGRVINRYVPFFNPSMQGLDKAARTFRENPQAALLKCLLYISLPSLLLRLWILSDDDREKEYQEFPSRLRDMYWLIPTGKGDWKRLPKPFELGVLFGSSVERVVTLAAKKNQAFRGYAKSVQEAMTPSLMIQIFAPWLETWANRSMFYDRPIVGKSREGLPEELQYTATTTETAKLVGRLFKISPMKVDHIWRGYTGTVGANALSAVEAVARSLGALPESKREARRWSEAPFINAFTAIPYKGSESLSRFYDVSEETAKKLAGAKAENKPFRDADIAMEFAKARRMLSTLWKDMENIRASDLPPVEKRDKMDKLTLRAVDFARNAMARYDRVMERRND